MALWVLTVEDDSDPPLLIARDVDNDGRRVPAARPAVRRHRRERAPRATLEREALAELAAMGLYRSTGGHWNGDSQVMFEYDLTIDGPTRTCLTRWGA